MKILVVCSISSGKIAPFITEQVIALNQQGIKSEYFTINGKGIIGYLKHYFPIIKKIKEFNPDLIHAHYGLSGLVANLQRNVPVITTYHGSDINHPGVFILSRLCFLLSSFNIFVSKESAAKARQSKKYAVIPCGIDIDLFMPIEKNIARDKLKIPIYENSILFAGSFTNHVKNYQLARISIQKIPNIKLIELKDFTRKQVALQLNANDLLLLTSFSEGSPQIIKEAMACNCPIVSTDVGDVRWVIGTTEGCFVATSDPDDVYEKINFALAFSKQVGRTKGRERIIGLELDNKSISNKIIEVYKNVLSNK